LTGKKRKDLTPDGEVVERGGATRVKPAFLATFLAVCEFAIVMNKNQDQTLPTRRAQALWEALFAKGLVKEKFCARKWAVCREAMARQGVIRITDRSYGPGRAMRWSVGPYYPFLGLWKKHSSVVVPREQSTAQGQKTGLNQERIGGVGVSTCGRREEAKSKRHNTLLYKQPVESTACGGCQLPRPPPAADRRAKKRRNWDDRASLPLNSRLLLRTRCANKVVMRLLYAGPHRDGVGPFQCPRRGHRRIRPLFEQPVPEFWRQLVELAVAAKVYATVPMTAVAALRIPYAHQIVLGIGGLEQ
jgi:hypothetical protein